MRNLRKINLGLGDQRAYKICNSYTIINKEFEEISTLLQKNYFSQNLIDMQTSTFFNKKFKPIDNNNIHLK